MLRCSERWDPDRSPALRGSHFWFRLVSRRQGGEFLDEICQVISEVLRVESGFTPELAETTAREIVAALCKRIGGNYCYFPSRSPLDMD
jgi:Mor transcription activator family